VPPQQRISAVIDLIHLEIDLQASQPIFELLRPNEPKDRAATAKLMVIPIL
jgi:hypothetical protein